MTVIDSATDADFRRLRATVSRFRSNHAGEQVAAVEAGTRLLAKMGITWEMLIDSAGRNISLREARQTAGRDGGSRARSGSQFVRYKTCPIPGATDVDVNACMDYLELALARHGELASPWIHKWVGSMRAQRVRDVGLTRSQWHTMISTIAQAKRDLSSQS